MKKSLVIILGTALALVGCAKVYPDASAGRSPDLPINFYAANYVGRTKANGQSAFPTDKTFKVQAYYTGASDWESVNSLDATTFTLEDAVAYMQGAEVTYDSSTGKWAPTGQTYYWPKTGYLSFIGWTCAKTVIWETEYSFVEFRDVYPSDGDLMISDVANDRTAANSANGVHMTFHHVLAKVNFKAMAKDTVDGITHHIVLNSISIKKVKNKGNYFFDFTFPDDPLYNYWNPYPYTTDDYDVYTNPSAAAAEIGDTIDGPLDGELTTEASAPLLPDGQLVIPQYLESSSVIELNYVIYYCNAAGKVLDKYTGSQVEYPINTFSNNGTPITSWEENTIYTYTIVIDPNSPQEITFVPEITDWSSADAIQIN